MKVASLRHACALPYNHNVNWRRPLSRMLRLRMNPAAGKIPQLVRHSLYMKLHSVLQNSAAVRTLLSLDI